MTQQLLERKAFNWPGLLVQKSIVLRRETWWHTSRGGAGEGAESSTSGSTARREVLDVEWAFVNSQNPTQ